MYCHTVSIFSLVNILGLLLLILVSCVFCTLIVHLKSIWRPFLVLYFERIWWFLHTFWQYSFDKFSFEFQRSSHSGLWFITCEHLGKLSWNVVDFVILYIDNHFESIWRPFEYFFVHFLCFLHFFWLYSFNKVSFEFQIYFHSGLWFSPVNILGLLA